MRWLGGMWLVAIAFIAAPYVVGLAGSNVLLTPAGGCAR